MTINRNITNTNYTHADRTAEVWEGQKRSIEWLTLHYTANGKSYKGMAKNNTIYFKNEYRGASAHYFVDDAEIWQCVEDRDSSWHCGDAASRNGCHNWNSIGIEICDNNGEFTESALKLAAELVKYLMGKYNIPLSHVCRHYDVTGKLCPVAWAKNNAKWQAFLKMLTDKPVIKPTDKTIKVVGKNRGRGENELIQYTTGKNTGTNKYGYEVAIDKNGIALTDPQYKGKTEIPSGGCVLSGHGDAGKWLFANIKQGYKVTIAYDDTVWIDKFQHRTVDNVNGTRGTGYLCVYNKGSTASTNPYGFEVAISAKGYAIDDPIYGKGHMEIPEGGFVVSGHQTNTMENSGGSWVYKNIHKGMKVKFDGKVLTVG